MSSNRRELHWDRVRSYPQKVAVVLASALGSGLLPKAPGTWGTLVGIPIAYALADSGVGAKLVTWAALFVAGTWAAKVFDETMGTEDNQNIVIDEVVGYGITAWNAGTHPLSILAAFILFRFFDMVKPFPVGRIDAWSHHQASGSSALKYWWTGFGVMADDLAAGLLGLGVMTILQQFRWIP